MLGINKFKQSVIVSPMSEVLVEVCHLLDRVQSMFLTIIVRVWPLPRKCVREYKAA
jgi:hypothetical protein